MTTVTFNFRTQNAESVRREIQRTLDATRQGQRAVQGQSQQAAQRSASAEQAATRAVLTEAAKRTQARQQEVAQVRQQESAVTAAMLAEDRKRTTAHTASQRARLQSFQQYVNAVRQGERQLTREQQQAQRQRAATWGNRASQAASMAMGVGSSLHGQIQDARRQRAQTERTAGLAFYQAGARTPGEIQRRMQQASAFAQDSGMSMDELLSAANAAQTEFSSLQGNTEGERADRFRQLLETARLGRDTGNNPAEFARLQGMLAQSGFDPAMQRQALLFTAGAAQRGAVEAGSLTREAMGAIMRRMSDATGALGANATTDQRRQAALGAFQEQVAELQVFRGTGFSVRRSGEALSNLQESLRNSGRQDKILQNIRTRREEARSPAERAALQTLETTLFERDPTRRGNAMRLRESGQNPLGFVAAMSTAFGGNATAITNLLSGTGAGNPMSLLLNQRGLLGALAARNAEGRTGAQRVQELMNPDTALTEERVREGAGVFANDSLSNLNREENARMTALTDNTSALVRLSNALAGFQANNPMLSTAGGTVAAALASGGASSLGAAASASSAAGSLGGVAAAGGAGVLASIAAVLGAGAAGVVAGDALNQYVEGGNIGRNANGTDQDQARSVLDFFSSNGQSTLGAFVQELRELPQNIGRAVQVNGFSGSPQAMVHAATQLGTANGLTAEQRANRM